MLLCVAHRNPIYEPHFTCYMRDTISGIKVLAFIIQCVISEINWQYTANFMFFFCSHEDEQEYYDVNKTLIFFARRNNHKWARFSSLSRLRDRTQTHHTRQDSSGRVISPVQRPLHDNSKRSQETDVRTSGGIRTHNISKRTVSDLRLRPRGHYIRLKIVMVINFTNLCNPQ